LVDNLEIQHAISVIKMKKRLAMILFILLICSFILSCSEFEYTSLNSDETGSISFHVEWRGAPTRTEAISSSNRALDCVASNIETVTFIIVDINDNELASDFWPCDRGSGIVEGVPAGTNRKLIVEGEDDQGRVIYRGIVEGITVVAGQHEDVETVVCDPVEVIDAAYLQYRTYQDGTNTYRGWIDFTIDGGPIDLSAITLVTLNNSTGSSVFISDFIFYQASQFNGTWNELTSSVDYTGPSYYSGFSIGFPEVTSLASGDYTYYATTSQEDILSTTLYFPGEIILPTVDDANMNYQWRINSNLYLSWDIPTGNFDQLRIVITDQNFEDLLYVKLPTDANELIVPGDIIQSISDFKDPSEANWMIQTRSYTNTSDNNNYARGYSNFINFSWQPIPNSLNMALIPSGCFDMGDAFGEGGGDELPVHNVCITSGFYMDVHEVTNAEYNECVGGGGCTAPGSSSSSTRTSYYGNPDYDDFPVIYVNWDQANNYCTWAGKRLPTEAEWEYAARGGLSGNRYPWSDTISGSDANYRDSGDPWDNDTSQVEYYAANGYGLYDMAGNVWEWVNDWYQNDYYDMSPTNDPPGPDPDTYRVLRGGSWYNATTYNLRVALRFEYTPTNQDNFMGFRCAGD